MTHASKITNILCVSDTIDPLVYSPNIKKRYGDIDLVIGSGDLPMTYLGYIATTLNCPLLFVFGNHNLARYEHFKNHHHPFNSTQKYHEETENRQYLQRTFGATYIGGKCVRVKKILFAGLGGSICYNNGKNQYTNFQMYVKVLRLLPRLILNKILYGRYIDVFATHAAPYGINDLNDPCHVGFRAFRWFIKAFSPRYLLHGHIHLYDLNSERIATYMHTKVINVYSQYILEYTHK